jgi:hypothetical protein
MLGEDIDIDVAHRRKMEAVPALVTTLVGAGQLSPDIVIHHPSLIEWEPPAHSKQG